MYLVFESSYDPYVSKCGGKHLLFNDKQKARKYMKRYDDNSIIFLNMEEIEVSDQ